MVTALPRLWRSRDQCRSNYAGLVVPEEHEHQEGTISQVFVQPLSLFLREKAIQLFESPGWMGDRASVEPAAANSTVIREPIRQCRHRGEGAGRDVHYGDWTLSTAC